MNLQEFLSNTSYLWGSKITTFSTKIVLPPGFSTSHEEQTTGVTSNCSLSFSSDSYCHVMLTSPPWCLPCWPTHLPPYSPCCSYFLLGHCKSLPSPIAFFIFVPPFSYSHSYCPHMGLPKRTIFMPLPPLPKIFSSSPLYIGLTSKSFIWHSKLVKWLILTELNNLHLSAQMTVFLMLDFYLCCSPLSSHSFQFCPQ